jgi:hypothetical protein
MRRIVAAPVIGNLLRFLFSSHRLGDRPIGRTPDSESGYPGSSPGLPANLFNELAKTLLQTWEHYFFQTRDSILRGLLDRLNVEGQRSLRGRVAKNL